MHKILRLHKGKFEVKGEIYKRVINMQDNWRTRTVCSNVHVAPQSKDNKVASWAVS